MVLSKRASLTPSGAFRGPKAPSAPEEAFQNQPRLGDRVVDPFSAEEGGAGEAQGEVPGRRPLKEAGIGGNPRPGVPLLEHGPHPERGPKPHLLPLQGVEAGGEAGVKPFHKQAHPGPSRPLPPPEAQGEGVFPLVVHLRGHLPKEAVEEAPEAQGLGEAFSLEDQDQGGEDHG